jgi:RimJ/RimL family protein N-acetyltransferase
MVALPLPKGLQDGGVALRGFVPDDVPAVAAACQDPLIARFTAIPTPYREEHARAWIEGQAQQRQAGQALDLAVVDAEDGRLLGAVGLAAVAWEHRRAEAGFWVAPQARGAGVASRALGLLAGWALAPPLALVRLQLSIDVANAASQRTAQRAGFAREGVLRSFVELKGRRSDVAIYARLADGG